MKFLAFSIFDKAAENFNTPMFLAAKGQAIRAFDDQANSPDSMIYKHPTDYVLYHIGEYDDSNGLLTPLLKPHQMGSGLDFKREEKS
jgi:hypothetical protein